MKFSLAILVFLLIGFFFCEGILQLVAGKPWLFIITLTGFLVAFARIGCKSS
jgi:uncharacterized membrane protein YccC